MGESYPAWGPNAETELHDNQESWLPTSDLVFVDPVGTGFSRATSTAYRDVLYADRGDTEATAEFIRVYLNRFNGWASPLFIAGESYGTTRAMGVSEALEKRRTRLDGVVLISGGFDVGQRVPQELVDALDVSMFAATAYYHKRLSADLQSLPRDEVVRRAAEWARSTYAPALAKRDSLATADRAALLATLHRYTGIDLHDVDQRTLIIQKAEFSDRLLADRGLELGRYDSRMTIASRPRGAVWSPLRDPSLLPMIDLMQGTSRLFNSYVRDTLQYRNDLLYRGPFGGAFHPLPLATNGAGFAEDWMSNMWNRGGRGRGEAEGPNAEIPPLRHALDLDPKLRVMNMKGIYDASCAAMDETVSRVEPYLKARISNRCYVGGHMMYSDLETRRAMQRDFDEFVHDAIAARRAP
jgi:carboxypeptidase C (cathepsin A)